MSRPATSLPAITVHDLAQARAALRAAAATSCAIALLSPPGAAGYLGVSWMPALKRVLGREAPSAQFVCILDCAEDAGLVMAALRQKAADSLVFTGEGEIRVRLAEIAGENGMALLDRRPASLELAAADDPERACRDWLGASEAEGRAGD